MNASERVKHWLSSAPVVSGIESVIVSLDAEAAARVKSKNFARQRRLSQDSVQQFSERIHDGMFVDAAQMRIAIDDKGRIVVTDGQHRLDGVVNSASPAVFELLIVRGDPSYDYERADSVARKKSVSDAIKVKSASAILRRLSSVHQRAIVGGLRMVLNGMRAPYKMASKSYEMRQCVDRWSNEIEQSAELALSANRRNPMSSVWAAMIATARYCPDRHAVFWRAALTGEMLQQSDPRMRLFLYLLNPPTRNANEILAACTKCWNAHAAGEAINLLRVGLVDIEARMTGIPDEVYSWSLSNEI